MSRTTGRLAVVVSTAALIGSVGAGGAWAGAAGNLKASCVGAHVSNVDDVPGVVGSIRSGSVGNKGLGDYLRHVGPLKDC